MSLVLINTLVNAAFLGGLCHGGPSWQIDGAGVETGSVFVAAIVMLILLYCISNSSIDHYYLHVTCLSVACVRALCDLAATITASHTTVTTIM